MMIRVRSAYLLSIAICFSILFQGCNSSSNKWEKIHPDPARLPADEEVDYSLDISESNNDPLPHFFHPDSLYTIAIIGNDTTLDNTYYNTPQKLDIDPDGNIYIVQEHTNSIRVYDRNGHFIYSIGREGKGPGEFIDISRFVFDQDYRKLYALDAFEIEVFALPEDQNRFEYETAFSHSLLRPFDLCLLNNDLFVSGYKIAAEEKNPAKPGSAHDLKAKVTPPITRIDLETFEPTLSFGYEYKTYAGYGTHEGTLSETLLSCNEATDTIVGYLKRYPFMFGYDRDGRPKWVSRMDGYISTEAKEWKTPEYNSPGLIPHANEGIFNYKYPIQEINNGEYSLLQFMYRNQHVNTYSDSLKFESILVDTETGKLFHSGAYDYIGLWKGNKIITADGNVEMFQHTYRINELLNSKPITEE